MALPKKNKISPPGEKKHESAGACELSGLFEETSTLPKRQGSSPPCLIRLRLRSRNTNRQSHRFSNWDPVSAGREASSCSLGCYGLCRTHQCTSANRTSFFSVFFLLRGTGAGNIFTTKPSDKFGHSKNTTATTTITN